MAKLKVLTFPHPLLRQKSKPIKKVDKKIKKLAQEMIDFLQKGPNGQPRGIGLAAPQVGKLLRLFIAYSPKSRRYLVFINPQIVWKSKRLTKGVPERQNKLEGCLSVPGVFALIKRYQTIKIHYKTLNNYNITRRFSGFTATVIQHELDHLEGILFVDRAKEQKAELFRLEQDKSGKEVLLPLLAFSPLEREK